MSDVWMHESEIRAIEKYINKDSVVLEWGSGGSTIHFAKLAKEYYSIEHNTEWYNRMLPSILPNTAYYHVPAQYTIEDPNQSTYNSFANYIDMPLRLGKMYDFVLIDGRARRLCAYRVIPFLNPGAVVAIHDWVLRTPYHCVLDYYDIIEAFPDTPQTLGIFKLKDNVTSLSGYNINLKTDERL